MEENKAVNTYKFLYYHTTYKFISKTLKFGLLSYEPFVQKNEGHHKIFEIKFSGVPKAGQQEPKVALIRLWG
jgi:hypothetical protein